jgi:chemotaxis protein CheX
VEIPDDLVDAFAAAVPFALKEMADVEPVVRESEHERNVDEGSADMSACVRLTTAAGVWRLILSFPERTAAALARRILVETDVEVSPEMIRDCIGEVANVLAGQAKALLVGRTSHFTLSTPTVQVGDLAERTADRFVIYFDSNVGEFTVHLCPSSD